MNNTTDEVPIGNVVAPEALVVFDHGSRRSERQYVDFLGYIIFGGGSAMFGWAWHRFFLQ